jgi:hypothetical protein
VKGQPLGGAGGWREPPPPPDAEVLGTEGIPEVRPTEVRLLGDSQVVEGDFLFGPLGYLSVPRTGVPVGTIEKDGGRDSRVGA